MKIFEFDHRGCYVTSGGLIMYSYSGLLNARIYVILTPDASKLHSVLALTASGRPSFTKQLRFATWDVDDQDA